MTNEIPKQNKLETLKEHWLGRLQRDSDSASDNMSERDSESQNDKHEITIEHRTINNFLKPPQTEEKRREEENDWRMLFPMP